MTLLFVGRLDFQKGFDILLEALRLVPRTDVVLNVAGDAVLSDMKTNLQPMIAAESRLRMLGWLSPEALEPLYRQADVVIIPSRWEGFGYVAVEAMRAGCAVFASRRGGLPEIIEDGSTGKLFDPTEPRELADLINQADPVSLHKMGALGYRRFTARFTAVQANTALFSFYDRLAGIDGSQPAPPTRGGKANG